MFIIAIPIAVILWINITVTASTSAVDAKYASKGESSSRDRASFLPTDLMKADQQNVAGLRDMFKNIYVNNVTGADCSFIAAFMLMYVHDTEYPYKIVTAENSNTFQIKYPGYDLNLIVTPKDMEKFFQHVEKKWTFQSIFRRHNIPRGIDTLRCAYYEHQRSIGERPPVYRVYGGGFPISDMMVMSGIREGGVIYADKVYENISDNRKTFANCRESIVKYALRDGKTVQQSSDISREIENPLGLLGNANDYLIIVCTAANLGRLNAVLGKYIPNHAYYLLEVRKDKRYVLGNPYQTNRNIDISEKEFLDNFNSIHYVRVH